ncbi:GNAT family N-acetyltransferase [Desulfovibrio sp. ZJ369]|uniref:GNAT family N-acetyltransferase n=1 Tax=Desulfovibrio sp. ZJ369 TaxID=2709793 RepID=UPI0013EB1A2E|nr:GNAT family N-acetyltransferase [Desulfovibrio sp. ZJ369]
MTQDSRQRYTDFLSQNPASIFHQPWWLDATCGPENWDVVFARKKEHVIAALPFFLKKGRFGQIILGQPPLTPFLGPVYSPGKARYARRLQQEHTIFEELLRALPPCHLFHQCFSPAITNWLVFRWNGFQQSTNYTYRLYNIKNHESLWNETEDNIRTDVRKAQNRFALHIEQSDDIGAFLDIYAGTWKRQGKRTPHSTLIRNIDAACASHSCRRMLFAVDEGGRRHAATYIVWDQDAAYYLLGGSDPKLRQSGAHTFVVWESILQASKYVDVFDFEGSNIRSIEKNFRAFGARQTPLFWLERATPLFRKIMLLRDILTGPWK